MGEILRAGLRSINSPIIKEVRGRGLMNALVINPAATNGLVCFHPPALTQL
jgi:ornithine--oxo-acid transaminase